MKKQFALLGALFLACGSGSFAYAAPAPAIVASSEATQIVKGTVVDENGEPVIGASVTEPGTNRGTTTDIDGKFSIKAGRNAKLQVSFIGMKTVTVAASDGMAVTMKADNALLDEVVVVGYGQQKKVNLTGAVSNVDIDKTMASKPVGDVGKALQGAVPGLTILNNTGDINSNPTMKIRGITGSLTSSSDPYIIVDGVPMDDISFLNPGDIASISVLKDAASSSIYGARAAFGVVLITTKSGKQADKIHVNYDNNFSWDKSTYLPDYASVPRQIYALSQANQRMGVDNELFGMYLDKLLPYAEAWEKQHNGKKSGYREMQRFQSWDNVGDYYMNDDGSGALYYADWDVKNILYRTAPSMQHNINVQGSTGRTTFYASFGYNSRESVDKFNPDKFKRYTAALNLSTNITDWLQAGIRFNYSNKQYDRPNQWRDAYTYQWRWGSFFGPYGTINGYDCANGILYRKGAKTAESRDYLTRITGFLKANLTKDITLNADYTFSTLHYNDASPYGTYTGMNTWGGNISAPKVLRGDAYTYMQNTNVSRNAWTLNVYANWNKVFANDHTVNVMLGANGEGWKRKYFWVKRMHLMDENFEEINLADGAVTTDGTHTHGADAGYFGRINYDYKGIYLLELNGRYDGSSKFRENERWAFFPSASLGYRFSQEKYWNSLRNVVSNGKLRVSYGEIGNDQVEQSYFLSTAASYSPSSVHWVNGAGNSATKLVQTNMPSLVAESLSWERIRTTDVGIDLGFLNDQITVGFDWFQRDTRDMIAPGKTLPSVLGTTTPRTNAGSLRSRGWELSLMLRHQFTNDLSLYFNGSISDAKIKVTEWTDDSRLLNTNYTGKTYGDIWGFETERYFTEDDFNADGSYKKGVASQKGLETSGFVYGPGDIKFKDQDGNGVIDWGDGTAENHGDLVKIGNSTPRYEYSFHIGGNWKGFDLDLFFQGVGKRKLWTTGAFVMPFMRGADATYAHQESYNTYDFETGKYTIDQNNDYPRLWGGNDGYGVMGSTIVKNGCHNFYPQSRYIVDMSYLRLKNVTLGYTLPQVLTRKAMIEKLRFYFSTNNLCLLHKGSGKIPVDPEVNANSSQGAWGRTNPITKAFSFGLQATF